MSSGQISARLHAGLSLGLPGLPLLSPSPPVAKLTVSPAPLLGGLFGVSSTSSPAPGPAQVHPICSQQEFAVGAITLHSSGPPTPSAASPRWKRSPTPRSQRFPTRDLHAKPPVCPRGVDLGPHAVLVCGEARTFPVA